MNVITDARCLEFSRPGHPERPQRISRTVDLLKQQGELALNWEEPGSVEDAPILRAHNPQHLQHVRDSQEDFDADTPAYRNIEAHARRSVAGALKAMDHAFRRETAFSLLRPPGHHATPDRAMGFCFYNSIAIAVLEAKARGAGKVAVFDFDVHHGNGTEAILLDREGCAFFSVHQYPAYPGSGAAPVRNCWNFPVRPGATRELYRHNLAQAFEQLQTFKPDLIAVSAGFDAYRGDPLSDEALEAEDFHWLGEIIGSSGIPAFSVLEGGYSKELPQLILAYLTGWSGNEILDF